MNSILFAVIAALLVGAVCWHIARRRGANEKQWAAIGTLAGLLAGLGLAKLRRRQMNKIG